MNNLNRYLEYPKINVCLKAHAGLNELTLYTPSILHPICGISPGFPKIPSKFPQPF